MKKITNKAREMVTKVLLSLITKVVTALITKTLTKIMTEMSMSNKLVLMSLFGSSQAVIQNIKKLSRR